MWGVPRRHVLYIVFSVEWNRSFIPKRNCGDERKKFEPGGWRSDFNERVRGI